MYDFFGMVDGGLVGLVREMGCWMLFDLGVVLWRLEGK